MIDKDKFEELSAVARKALAHREECQAELDKARQKLQVAARDFAITKNAIQSYVEAEAGFRVFI